MARFRLLAVLVFVSTPIMATTFVVPSDDELFRRADAVVVASVVDTWSMPPENGLVMTASSSVIEEVIKGRLRVAEVVTTLAPTSRVGRFSQDIHGSPRFRPGTRVLLFLFEWAPGQWSTVDLAVGKFEFEDDGRGNRILVRVEGEITGWDEHLRPFRDKRRDADRFLHHLRALGGKAPRHAATYFIESAPLTASDSPTRGKFLTQADAIVLPASNYLMEQSGNLFRWNNFGAQTVPFREFTAGGAVPGAATALTAATAMWTNDSGSNVTLANGGLTQKAPPLGLNAGAGSTADGESTVRWEIDLFGATVSDFVCSAGGFSGLLGIGGPTGAGASHTFDGVQYFAIVEGDVDMNRGLASPECAGFPQTLKNVAVAHEIGHALNFRHSDKNRADNAACTAPLPCSSLAVMTSVLPNGIDALQGYDVDAVRAVYPGAAATLVGDVDGNGVLDEADLTAMKLTFRTSSGAVTSVTAAFDCSGDGQISGRDIVCVEDALRPLPGSQTSTFDIDRNGSTQALTDGLLVLRRLFGFSGTTLTNGAVAADANRPSAAAIQAYIQAMDPIFDVDGDNLVQPLTDGLLLLRYAFGFRGTTLINGAVGGGATRTTAAAIEAYIASL